MKRIVFITYNLKLGGTSSTLYDLIGLLDKQKYDITIFTVHDGGNWEHRFREAGVRVINAYSRMRKGRNFVQKVQNKLKLIKIESIRRGMGKGLIEYCTGERFDLAVLHHSYEPYELAPFIPDAATIRYIHGDVKNNERFCQVLSQSERYFSRYDKIICVSEVARRSFCDVFGCEGQAEVCYNPLNSEKVEDMSREPMDIDVSAPFICTVGRLAPEKGFVRLVHIHRRLLNAGIEHNLVIIGEGPEREQIECAIRETGTQDSVFLLGYRENPYPYIRNSAFTVCPSYSEGLHMVSMESICLGVPVVAAVEPVRELFGEECCGIITENDDDSLEAGIRKMLEDRDFYEKAVCGAKKRSSAFDGKTMVSQVERIFDQVMESKE